MSENKECLKKLTARLLIFLISSKILLLLKLNDLSDIPNFLLKYFNDSIKDIFSFFIKKENISPPTEQAPKHLHIFFSGSTIKEGVFSL